MPESLESIFNRMMQRIQSVEVGGIKRYNDADLRLIERAFRFAHNAHEYRARQKNNQTGVPQRRRNGDFYVSHCAAVTEILIEKLLPSSIPPVEMLVTALLHDVIEDTQVSRDEIRTEFGETVYKMVEGLTKFEDENRNLIALRDDKENGDDWTAQSPNKVDINAETIRKILLASIDNPLVPCIKLADRLHNMRTLEHMPPEKQKRIAGQTMEIYAPLANRMGLWTFKSELEDLSFRYLHPKEYQIIRNYLEHHTAHAQTEIQILKRQVSEAIIEECGNALPFEIQARQKHAYSIFRKMQRKNIPIDSLDRVADILGLRIILGKYDPQDYDLNNRRLKQKIVAYRNTVLLPANQPLPDEVLQKLRDEIRYEDGILASDAPELAAERRALQEKLRNLRREIQEDYDKLYKKEPYKSDCYKILGIIHMHYSPVEGEFDDYIITPKPNGYRSLHTAVNFIDSSQRLQIVEFQIRTAFMHYEAEYGANLAHWGYKEGIEKMDQASWMHINNLRRALQEVVTDSEDAIELVDNTREQVFADQIFVITPKGDVIQLPVGSTPIDFAYAVHTDIGHRCRGARVNDKLVPLNTPLHNGDKVEIITVRRGGPSRDWLNQELEYVRSPRARSKIRLWFRAQQRTENIMQGTKILEDEMKRLGVKITDLNLTKLVADLKYRTLDEFYYAIGSTDLSIPRIINQIRLQGQQIVFDELRTTVLEEQHIEDVARMLERQTIEELYFDLAVGAISQATLRARFKELETRLVYQTPTAQLPKTTVSPKFTPPASKNREIEIPGFEGDFLYTFARCCKPVRGEPITGYLTRGRGVTIHASDCPTILRMQNTPAHARLLPVFWSGSSVSKFYVPVYIEAYNRVGLLNEITNIAKNEGIDLQNINTTHRRSDSIAIITAEFSITDMNQLHRILTKIRELKNVNIAQRYRN